MEQRTSWEAHRVSASQEIPRILCNPKVHYRIHKSPPHVPILRQVNPVHDPNTTPWRSIAILSSHQHLALPSGLFPSCFPIKTLYSPFVPHTCYVPRLSHSSRFKHPNNIGWAVLINTFIIMYFSPLPCYLFPLKHQHLLQHPILKHPQPTIPPSK